MVESGRPLGRQISLALVTPDSLRRMQAAKTNACSEFDSRLLTLANVCVCVCVCVCDRLDLN